MLKLVVHNEAARKLTSAERESAVKICPFGAIDDKNGVFEISSGCKMCKICTRKGPDGIFELVEIEDATEKLNKDEWKGIAVFIDNTEGSIHPVSLELIGKAKELAAKINHPVYALFIGYNVNEAAKELLHYGVDEIFTYDYKELDNFLIEPYTNAFNDFIKKVKPSSILVGATPAGRSLAPRVAARARTGLTADCTKLDMKENTDLVQIRPAFGGNIMAQINTPNHRPQLATVRYKIFNEPERLAEARGKITACELPAEELKSRIKVISISKKEKSTYISEADIIVACGRGMKSEKDMELAHELCEILGAEIAATRPLVEAGWISANRQIGLSGRTVKPKLIITLGVSGAVQFKAGMENSDLIVSLDTDEHAPIFDTCHYAVNGDIYDIIPKLLKMIKERR